MQLRVARLCLDCEEVHDQFRCPVCASDHFTYMTRWVPVPERRQRPRPPVAPSPDIDVYRQLIRSEEPRRGGRLFSRALIGLGAASVLGLFLGGRQARARTPESSDTNGHAADVSGADEDEYR
jgi:hypothetical protein